MKSKWVTGIILILCLFAFLSVASARMGYDIDFGLDGFNRHISRSTQEMNYSVDGVVLGEGKFQRYNYVNGFAGINAKETRSSAQVANLKYAEKTFLKAREGPVNVIVKLASGINESENESEIVLDENGELRVDERWTTHFYHQEKIEYLGPGLISTESYINNGDLIKTYLESWKLKKDSIYIAFINRSVYDIKIDAPYFSEQRFQNQTTIYVAETNTTGMANRLRVFKPGTWNSSEVYIDQNYVGDQGMKIKITMGEQVIIPDNDTIPFLECCLGPGENLDNYNSLYNFMNEQDLDEHVFDPANQNLAMNESERISEATANSKKLRAETLGSAFKQVKYSAQHLI